MGPARAPPIKVKGRSLGRDDSLSGRQRPAPSCPPRRVLHRGQVVYTTFGRMRVTDDPFILQAGRLSLQDLERFWRRPARIALDSASYTALERSAETVAKVVAEGRRVYGINTGFGSLARQTISAGQVSELQTRLVLSHSCGVGQPPA